MPARLLLITQWSLKRAVFSRPLEAVSAFVMLCVGLKLLQVGDTMVGPTYRFLLVWATEETWGYITASLAFVRLFALILNGHHAWTSVWTTHARAVTALLSCVVWLVVAWTLHAANRDALLPIVLFSISTLDGVLTLFVSFQAGMKEVQGLNGRS